MRVNQKLFKKNKKKYLMIFKNLKFVSFNKKKYNK